MRGLYAIIDPEHCGAHTPVALAEAVLRGGCAALQLRAKRGSDAEYLALGAPIRDACRRMRVPFIVNDRVEAAVALAADGLHLGQHDMPIEQARLRYQGPIGLSTHSHTQVDDAFARGAALVGFGPVFQTGSKQRPDPVVGLAGLQRACERAKGTVVAIGGIDVDTLAGVVSAGAACVAVIGVLARSTDPAHTARTMHRAICQAATRV